MQQSFVENHQVEYLSTGSCSSCHSVFGHLSDHIGIADLQSPSPRGKVALAHLAEDIHKDESGDARSLAGTAAHETGQFWGTSEVA